MALVQERGGSTRRDANHEHFNAFWEKQLEAYNTHFGDISHETIHLQILATLPKYQRHGYASLLCGWAVEVLYQGSLQGISVMASPMGYNLYANLGFKEVGTFCIQIRGEREKLTLTAMMYRPDPARVSLEARAD